MTKEIWMKQIGKKEEMTNNQRKRGGKRNLEINLLLLYATCKNEKNSNK